MRGFGPRLLLAAAIVFAVAAAWLTFSTTAEPATVQVSPDVTSTSYPSFCGHHNLTYQQTEECTFEVPIKVTTGRSEVVSFACTSLWSGWIESTPLTYRGVTYPDLSSRRSPTTALYTAPIAADASCARARQGRSHLLWTALVLVALALVAAWMLSVSQRLRARSNV